jgi:hypothetical protein
MLIRVSSGGELLTHLGDFVRRDVFAIVPRPVETELDSLPDVCQFFTVDSRDVDAAMEYLAKKHAGKEIQVYEMTQSGICPAADMVKKKVSADGTLPV